MKDINVWSIGLYQLNSNNQIDFKLLNPIIVFNSKKYQLFREKLIVYQADPFLFVKNGIIYMFYEQKERFGKGYICVRESKDLKKWSKAKIVLVEKYHLSFPFVFALDDKVYMLPEQGENKSLDLYISTIFPLKWKKMNSLIKEEAKFVDSSLYWKNEIIYLFSTRVTTANNRETVYALELYYSNSIEKEFIRHPKSPISENRQNARCAGSIFKYNNKLLRPAQDCTRFYGENISMYEITKLNIEDYEEVLFEEKLIDKSKKWSSIGGHHFSVADYNNKIIVATDGLQHDFWFNKFLYSLDNLFGIFFKNFKIKKR